MPRHAETKASPPTGPPASPKSVAAEEACPTCRGQERVRSMLLQSRSAGSCRRVPDSPLLQDLLSPPRVPFRTLGTHRVLPGESRDASDRCRAHLKLGVSNRASPVWQERGTARDWL